MTYMCISFVVPPLTKRFADSGFILNVSNNTTLVTVALFNFPAKLFLVQISRTFPHFADFEGISQMILFLTPLADDTYSILRQAVFTFEPKVLLFPLSTKKYAFLEFPLKTSHFSKNKNKIKVNKVWIHVASIGHCMKLS